MAPQAVLTVVIVRDPALREALARRLAAADINVVTEESAGDRRLIRRSTILLSGEAAIAGDLGLRIEREWIERRWRRIAMLTIDSPLDAGDMDWLAVGSAADRLSALFADWAAIAARPIPSIA